MPLTFNVFTVDFLQTFIRERFEYGGLMTALKQDLILFLQDLGYGPEALVNTAGRVASVAAPPKLELRSQGADETTAAFLERVDAFFKIAHIAPENQLAFFMSAARKDIAAFVATLITGGVTTFPEVREEVEENFLESPLQHLDKYLKMRPADNESFKQFGLRMKQAYLAYAGFSSAHKIEGDAETLLDKALTAQLLSIVSFGCKTQLQELILNDNTSDWDDILTAADAYVAARSGAGKEKKLGNNSRNQHEQRASYNSNWSNNNTHGKREHGREVVCYRCNRSGHISSFCPQLEQSLGKG